MMLHPLPLLKGMNHRAIDIHLVMDHHHLNHLSFLPLGLHYRLGLRLLLPLHLGIRVWLLPYLGSSGNCPVIGLLTVGLSVFHHVPLIFPLLPYSSAFPLLIFLGSMTKTDKQAQR
jgi:hypothetical protein